MKVFEKVYEDGNNLVIHRQDDVSASLERSALIRSNDLGRTPDYEPIASIPMVLATQWLEAEGLRWDSPHEAIRQCLERKVLDPDFAKLRLTDRRL